MSETLGLYKGLKCHHWDEELPLIADVLTTLRPKLVIETGTMFGGFAAFLADTIKPWDGQVVTFDYVIYPELEVALGGRDNLYFIRADVLGGFAEALIMDLAEEVVNHDDRLLFYADGPVGRPELFRYGWLADITGMHDFGTEIDPDRAARWAQHTNRVPFRHEQFAALQEQKGGYFVSRFWRRESLTGIQ